MRHISVQDPLHYTASDVSPAQKLIGPAAGLQRSQFGDANPPQEPVSTLAWRTQWARGVPQVRAVRAMASAPMTDMMQHEEQLEALHSLEYARQLGLFCSLKGMVLPSYTNMEPTL